MQSSLYRATPKNVDKYVDWLDERWEQEQEALRRKREDLINRPITPIPDERIGRIMLCCLLICAIAVACMVWK